MRLILSILMIAASIAGFTVFIVPHYHAIAALRVQEADYNQVLQNAKKLQQQRNQLVQKYNAFDPNNLAKLNTMLPNNPGNVKLILGLDAIAKQYGMALQNVKIDDPSTASQTPAQQNPTTNPDIGTLGIQFSLAGPYAGFENFLATIEKSLRIVDITKVSFTSTQSGAGNYQYTVGIKTYWVK